MPAKEILNLTDYRCASYQLPCKLVPAQLLPSSWLPFSMLYDKQCPVLVFVLPISICAHADSGEFILPGTLLQGVC